MPAKKTARRALNSLPSKPHPNYPFIRMVRWHDYKPSLTKSASHGIGADDWLALYPDGTATVEKFPCSEQELVDSMTAELHKYRPDLVDEYIERARESGNVDLLVRLVDERARFQERAALNYL